MAISRKKIRGKKTYLPQSSSHQEWNEIGDEYSQQNFFFREKTFFLDDIIDICRRFFTTGITTDLWVRWWGFSTSKASNGPFPEKKTFKVMLVLFWIQDNVPRSNYLGFGCIIQNIPFYVKMSRRLLSFHRKFLKYNYNQINIIQFKFREIDFHFISRVFWPELF